MSEQRSPEHDRPLQVQPAAFLDRDGVLNEDIGFLSDVRLLVWMPDAIQAVIFLRARGYRVFVVSNQSGVARGYFSEDTVHTLHRAMQRILINAGTRIDAFAFCPHHPEGTVLRYRLRCPCRKPEPGMIHDLVSRFPTDPTRSFMIGDKPTDLEAAQAAGIHGFPYTQGSLLNVVKQIVVGLDSGSAA